MLLVTNLVQTLSLVCLPFSRKLFRRINRFCADFWWGACVSAAQRLHGIHVIVTGDPVPADDQAIVVANHQQMPDILVLMMFARTKRRLGDMKWFVKDAIKFVPGAGWGMACLDCIYVKRHWETDRGKIKSIFSKFLEDRISIWLISFVEGTRITQTKLKKSQEFALAHQLPELGHVLLPRTKGFVASLEGLKGHVNAVYDMTIGYPHGIPTLWQVITGVATVFHLHIRRFPVSSLPIDPVEQSQWLIQRFVAKDALLAEFERNLVFPEHSAS
jgi:1-acyl-sn-glycerol-3-phosphate acyltransferase